MEQIIYELFFITMVFALIGLRLWSDKKWIHLKKYLALNIRGFVAVKVANF